MADEGWLLVGGALALLLLSRRESKGEQPPRSGTGPQPRPGPKSSTASKDKCAHIPPSQKDTDDAEWLPALLSEYHPDAPADQQRMFDLLQGLSADLKWTLKRSTASQPG